MSSFAPPFVQVQCSINGGAAVTGGQVVTAGQTIAFTLVNATGLSTILWEIFDYPLGWAVPAGWTQLASGVITFNGTQASPNPPSFTLPTTAFWGKWLVRATGSIGNQAAGNDPTNVFNPARMIDESCALSMLSTVGFRDTAAGETTQFGATAANLLEAWVRDLKINWRLLDGLFGGGSGGSPENPILVNASNTPFTAAPNTYLDVDSSSVAITINFPSLGAGQFVDVKLLTDPSVHNVTVNAPATKTIENPMGIGGGLGTLAASVTFSAANQKGESVHWVGCAAGGPSPYGTGNVEIR